MFVLLAMTLPASAAGVIPFALTQQIDANGRPLIGCKLNIYVVGTTATLQSIFSDFGLTLTLQQDGSRASISPTARCM